MSSPNKSNSWREVSIRALPYLKGQLPHGAPFGVRLFPEPSHRFWVPCHWRPVTIPVGFSILILLVAGCFSLRALLDRGFELLRILSSASVGICWRRRSVLCHLFSSVFFAFNSLAGAAASAPASAAASPAAFSLQTSLSKASNFRETMFRFTNLKQPPSK